MEFAAAIFIGLIFLVIADGLTPEKPSRTTEEEFGDAIAKYLTTTNKAEGDQNAKK